jgi:hypothetical protein
VVKDLSIGLIIIDDKNTKSAESSVRGFGRGGILQLAKDGSEPECTPFSLFTVNAYLATHHLHKPPGNGETQARVAVCVRPGGVSAIEAVENTWQVLGRYADASIADSENDRPSERRR